MWAQRSGVILVTINLEDCKKPEIKYVLRCKGHIYPVNNNLLNITE